MPAAPARTESGRSRCRHHRRLAARLLGLPPRQRFQLRLLLLLGLHKGVALPLHCMRRSLRQGPAPPAVVAAASGWPPPVASALVLRPLLAQGPGGCPELAPPAARRRRTPLLGGLRLAVDRLAAPLAFVAGRGALEGPQRRRGWPAARPPCRGPLVLRWQRFPDTRSALAVAQPPQSCCYAARPHGTLETNCAQVARRSIRPCTVVGK